MMRSTRIYGAMFLATLVAGAWAGCGDGGENTSGSSGGGDGGTGPGSSVSSTGSTTSSTTGPGSSSSTGGMLPDCNDSLADDFNLLEACEACLADSCCTEVS